MTDAFRLAHRRKMLKKEEEKGEEEIWVEMGDDEAVAAMEEEFGEVEKRAEGAEAEEKEFDPCTSVFFLQSMCPWRVSVM
jgi:hypothetical protein